MPLYDFRCDICGNFEAWRTLSELETPMYCPSCDAEVKRVFSAPMVNLNSGSLGKIATKSGEPRLVKREKDPKKPTHQNVSQGRPWMISH